VIGNLEVAGLEIHLELPRDDSPEWGAPHSIRTRYGDIVNGTFRLRNLLIKLAKAEVNPHGFLEAPLFDGYRSWPCVTAAGNRDRVAALARRMRTWQEQVNLSREFQVRIGMDNSADGPVMVIREDGEALGVMVFNPLPAAKWPLTERRWGVQLILLPY
jgi:hypothetical protein